MRKLVATIAAASALAGVGGLAAHIAMTDTGSDEQSVKIDNTGDGVEDVAYRWNFRNRFAT